MASRKSGTALPQHPITPLLHHSGYSVAPILHYPRKAARVVARAWVDADYKERLLADGTAAIAEIGYGGRGGESLRVAAILFAGTNNFRKWPHLLFRTEFKKEDRKRTQELEIKDVMNKNRKFRLLTIAMLPMICLLAFTGCSSMNATAKDNTALPDRTSYYLDGHAPG